VAIRKFSASSLTNPNSKSSKLWDQETTLGTFESIATATVTVAQGSVTFSNIPQGYTHLQIRSYWGLTDTGNNTWLNAQFNGDTGSNYSYHAIRSNPSGFVMSASYGTTRVSLGADNLGSATSYGVSIADILDYSSTTKNKTTKAFAGQDTTGVGTTNLWSGMWNNVNPITSIVIATDASTFRVGSIFSLYGIRGTQ